MSSLLNQFTYAVDSNFCPGLNKRSYKRSGMKKVKIASYQYRRNLIHFSGNITNYLKANYQVKNLKDIRSDYIYSFFKYKELTGCSHRTLVQYRSYINVLDKLITQTYHMKVHLKKGVPEIGGTPNKRVLYMRQEHIDAILELRKNSKSPALLALRINNIFGLRVSEDVKLLGKDFDLEKNTLHIVDSKGGRCRDLPLDTPEKLEIAKEINSKFAPNERVVPLRATSVNQFVTRALKHLNITDYVGANTVTHAIRKKVARDLYEQTNDKKAVTIHLGHNRICVADTYINAR